jgi:hypothetical protein
VDPVTSNLRPITRVAKGSYISLLSIPISTHLAHHLSDVALMPMLRAGRTNRSQEKQNHDHNRVLIVAYVSKPIVIYLMYCLFRVCSFVLSSRSMKSESSFTIIDNPSKKGISAHCRLLSLGLPSPYYQTTDSLCTPFRPPNGRICYFRPVR